MDAPDDDNRLALIARAIRHPGPDNGPALLAALALDRLPSQQEIYSAIEDNLLTPKQKLPEHWLSRYQLHWETKIAIPSLLSLSPSPPPTALAFRRSGLEGKVSGYVEARSPRVSLTARTSTSLSRAPAPASTFVRGKSGYVPFKPGGLEDAFVDQDHEDVASTAQTGVSKGTHLRLFFPAPPPPSQGLRTVPPGFSRGMVFPDEDPSDRLAPILGIDSLAPVRKPQKETSVTAGGSNIAAQASATDTEIDALLPAERLRTAISPSAPKPSRRPNVIKRDWAHVVDINQGLVNFHELVPDMAHKYPFELDNFQKEAVYRLEMGDSVFVAAHTSAGKTVVAEYAIALAAKHMTRAIYTSPIKALSNQKFRDFKKTFEPSSVGILTGDVQINPEGSCLVMTTEILRSMLYKGADLIRDVEFVIFDEVHYVNDAERGVVWEEVIIMLPEHVNIILLSATVPNTKEFADWVGRTKRKDIYVINTPKRPVPLEHYLYAGRETHKIVDAKGEFLGQGYKDAGEALRRKQDKEREAAGLPPVVRTGGRGAAPQRGGGGRGGARGSGGGPPSRAVAHRGGRGGGGFGSSGPRSFQQQDRNLWVHLVDLLRKRSLLPVVIFTFSKKRCEEQAGLLSNTDLCTAVEKSEVHTVIEKALTRLKGSDKKLPQIARMRDLLGRGIGVHHGGLLPIVKEVVEILFARGLVKVLFATETFAMGVNMPARSVVFSSIRKHDGRSFREILPGEYTQMSGRAGRRGLDATGVVIIVSGDELPETPILHKMMLGTPNKLQSQFRLTYNMILNLLRVEALRVEEMIKRSFSENASQRLLPDQQKKVLESEKSLLALPKLDCEVCTPDIRVYYDASGKLVRLQEKILSMALKSPQGVKYFTPGRVVILRDGHFRNNAAVLLKPAPLSTSEVLEHHRSYWVLALVDAVTKEGTLDVPTEAVPPQWPPHPDSLLVENGVYELATVVLSSIALVVNKTFKVDVDAIVERHLKSHMNHAIAELGDAVQEWVEAGSAPEVDWSKIRSLEFQEALQARSSLVQHVSRKACLLCGDFEHHYEVLHAEKILQANIADLKLALSDQNLELLPDYEQRIDVLKELKYIDENSTVLLKGRVACEINSANELILTELILENTLASFEPEEIVALLSALLFQEKTEVEPIVPPRLQEGLAILVNIAERVGHVQDRHRVAGGDFRASLKFGLVEVVYEWAKGMPFEQITSLTDVAEGTVVRVITRLNETCREVRDAARVIGDAELFKKMEDAQTKIQRDIVFAPSLYI
ncbi:hypothetical protein BOTBODRAFT_189538 [Botryobasidium botryosum FD-172 SS1]|uniref:Antiviral helicase n=1 Tax=Botryobasidium botryosum (strain FD-172 SS1) TaxID=930990 RepID=A0A067M8F2_BOTB1|nr:hypothetical protein BOTBODRAFT_189538 [Botryobasidium botryosum FD-172 SS1]